MKQKMALLLIFVFLRKKKVAKMGTRFERERDADLRDEIETLAFSFNLVGPGLIHCLFLLLFTGGAKANCDVNALSRGAFTVGG